MPKIRRGYKGAAVSTTLGAGGVTSATQTSIALASSPTTFPTGKFFVVVAPGTAQEEKMCVTLSGSTLTVVDPNVTSNAASTNGRGVDNTTARSTIAGGATVYPVATAIDFDEANELTSKYATQGSIVHQGATTFTELPIGTAGQALKVNSGATAPEWGQIAASGIASNAVTADKIDSTVAGNGLNGGGGSALSVNVDASTIEINADTLRVKDLGITTAKINDLAVTEGKIADNSITSAKIVDGTIVNADISGTAAITLSKLISAAAGQVIVHNGSGVPTATTISGDATVSSSGVVTIANDAVTTAKIQNGQVTAAKFATGLSPVYVDTTTGAGTTLPSTDASVAYLNTGDSDEGIITYNGTAWRKSWNMPWGWQGYAQVVANQTGIGTSATDLTGMSVTVNVVANRRYKITGYVDILIGATASYAVVYLTDASNNVLTQYRSNLDGTLLVNKFSPSHIYTSATTGSITFKLRAAGNAGTISLYATATDPSFILVEDIGPSGAPA